MESTNHTRALAARLVEKIAKGLPTPLSHEFERLVKEGYQSLNINTLVQGSWTVGQQFTIIRKALKNLRDETHSLEEYVAVPWEDLTFIMLRALEDFMSSHQPPTNSDSNLAKPAPSNTVPASKQKKAATKSAVVVTAKKNEASQVNPALPNVIDPVIINRIQNVVAQRLKGDEPLYGVKSQRFVKCTNKDCEFCRTMFMNLDLSACSMFGHPNCTEVGYFPHVGITMWKQLLKQHNSGQAFKIKSESKLKPGDIPRLSMGLTFSKPDSGSVSHKRPRITAMDEEHTSSSPSNWAEIMSDADKSNQ